MFESKGLKRTLASVFAVLAAAAPFIPPLMPFQSVIVELAGALGAVGLTHAAVTKLVK
jgi:hypothetical protein